MDTQSEVDRTRGRYEELMATTSARVREVARAERIVLDVHASKRACATRIAEVEHVWRKNGIRYQEVMA